MQVPVGARQDLDLSEEGRGEAVGRGGDCVTRELMPHLWGAAAAQPSLPCLGDVGPVLPEGLTSKTPCKALLNHLSVVKPCLYILFCNSFRLTGRVRRWCRGFPHAPRPGCPGASVSRGRRTIAGTKKPARVCCPRLIWLLQAPPRNALFLVQDPVCHSVVPSAWSPPL